MKSPIRWKEIDRRIWEEELEAFVPKRVFDIHTHIYDWRHTSKPRLEPKGFQKSIGKEFPLSSWDMCDICDRILLPDREVHRLAFPMPFLRCDFKKANAYPAAEVKRDHQSAALMLTHPAMTAEEIERDIEKEGFVGFKPYRFYSVTEDAVECDITDFFPKHQIAVADRYGCIVMLHLSKRAAVADPENLAGLERLTDRYPDVKWILAHCARSYYDRPLIKAGKRLGKIPNLWYEISTVCDADAMDALLSIAGPERVMYGSDDLSAGISRGKYINFGYGWAYLGEDNCRMDLSHCDPSMTFVRYEMLRAFHRAVRRRGYRKDEIENLFYGNASRLISLARKKGH